MPITVTAPRGVPTDTGKSDIPPRLTAPLTDISGATGDAFFMSIDIVDDLTVAAHDRANTWINVLNGPEGGWGIGGVAYTGNALLAAVAAAAEPLGKSR